MSKIGIVTDSTADLPATLAEQLGITVVPCIVHFGIETYRDGVDLSRHAFYARLRQATVLPTTAAPPVGVFEAAYRSMSEKVQSILSIHTSSSFSGICNAARLAAEQSPGLDVRVIDSGQVSMCVGFLAMKAAKLAEEGCPLQATMAAIRGMMPKLRLIAALDTIEFLRRGGRVNRVTALVGSLMNIKPILEIREGEIRLIDRVRGRQKSLKRLIQHTVEEGKLELAALMHADAPEVAREVYRMFASSIPSSGVLETEVGVTVGTHAGPGAVGFAVMTQ